MTDLDALARRAVACKGWRWVPGMLRQDGYRYIGSGIWARWSETAGVLTALHSPDQYPDLTDPAKLGCLLALVRKAWGDPRGCVVPMSGGRWGWKSATTVDAVLRRPVALRGDTEAEALVAALEAAP